MGVMRKNKCVKCKKDFGVREDVYQQRIKDYGGEQKLKDTYLCRKCRKTDVGHIAQKVKLKEKEEESKPQRKAIIFSGIQERKESIKDIVESLNDTCARPDIYLKSRRFCDECMHVEYCKCSLKKTKVPKKLTRK